MFFCDFYPYHSIGLGLKQERKLYIIFFIYKKLKEYSRLKCIFYSEWPVLARTIRNVVLIFEVSQNKGVYLYQGTGMANTTCTGRYDMVTTMLALTQMSPSPFVSARVKNEIVGSKLTGCVYNSIQ